MRMEMIADMNFPYPALEEQTHIAKILSDMDTEIETLEKKLTKHKELKLGLMPILLTGKIDWLKINNFKEIL